MNNAWQIISDGAFGADFQTRWAQFMNSLLGTTDTRDYWGKWTGQFSSFLLIFLLTIAISQAGDILELVRDVFKPPKDADRSKIAITNKAGQTQWITRAEYNGMIGNGWFNAGTKKKTETMVYADDKGMQVESMQVSSYSREDNEE